MVPNSGNLYPNSKPIPRTSHADFPIFVQDLGYPKLFPIFNIEIAYPDKLWLHLYCEV